MRAERKRDRGLLPTPKFNPSPNPSHFSYPKKENTPLLKRRHFILALKRRLVSLLSSPDPASLCYAPSHLSISQAPCKPLTLTRPCPVPSLKPQLSPLASSTIVHRPRKQAERLTARPSSIVLAAAAAAPSYQDHAAETLHGDTVATLRTARPTASSPPLGLHLDSVT